MPKSKNNWNVILCFVNGEPHLYNKKNRTYHLLKITPELALELVKQNINIEKIRPPMKKIWQTLAISINCCDGYIYHYTIKEENNINSFENIFTKKITEFLNELYPPEITAELTKKKREYERQINQKKIISSNIDRTSKERLMLIKSGKKLY